MGDRFSVDTGELGQFMRTLTEAHEALESVRKNMRDTTSGGIGTKDLDDACDEFQEHWKYGSEQIAEQTGKLKEAVGQTKANYEEVETALGAVFKKTGGPRGGTV
jgi:Excreted virulence factor EspC, type VII ESX diderm